jgi:NAD(P)H dehydrogenase (quinone)
LKTEWVPLKIGPLLFIDRMVSNDAASYALVKAEATIVHQGQWAASCRCLNPWPSGRIDRLGVRNSPTQNSKEPYITVFAWHQMIEAYLRDSGVAWTNLHPNMFMQSFLSVWSLKDGVYSAYTSKAVGFTALEDVAEAAAVILMEGLEKHNGKDYWFSADVLTPHQVAETLTAATGRKFTAAVRKADGFQNDAAQPGSAFEPAYAKGGFELFGQVEDGRMAYVGSAIDDTKKLLGREPLLLRDWAELHANELLEAAGT